MTGCPHPGDGREGGNNTWVEGQEAGQLPWGPWEIWEQWWLLQSMIGPNPVLVLQSLPWLQPSTGFLGLTRRQSRQQGWALSSARGSGLLWVVGWVVKSGLPQQAAFVCWPLSALSSIFCCPHYFTCSASNSDRKISFKHKGQNYAFRLLFRHGFIGNLH